MSPRHLIPAILLITSTTALARGPCGRIKLETDRFSEGQNAKVVVQALPKIHLLGMMLDPNSGTTPALVQALGNLRTLGIMMASTSGTTTLTVTVKEAGDLGGTLGAGAEILFRFEDGKILTLRTNQDAALQSYAFDTVVMTNVPYTFSLSEADLATFASSGLVAMRVPTVSTATTDDWDANKGVQKKLMAAAACMQTLAK